MRSKRFFQPPVRDKDEKKINRQIRMAKILLIDADGAKLGILSFDESLNRAEKAGLDLVEMSTTPEHAICKIMDYGKFKYQKKKKSHKSKAAQKNIDIKEIKINVSIGQNDFDTKVLNSKKFLSEGNKVKLIVKLRGRERARRELALEKAVAFKNKIIEAGKVEKEPGFEGSQFCTALFVPSNFTLKETKENTGKISAK